MYKYICILDIDLLEMFIIHFGKFLLFYFILLVRISSFKEIKLNVKNCIKILIHVIIHVTDFC